MKTIEGDYTTAKIFTDNVEDNAMHQVNMLVNNPVFKDCSIRIMPDVHAGKIGPIGFTSTIKNNIIPGIVGIDIGCGITMVEITNYRQDMMKLDKVIRQKIPSGTKIRDKVHRFAENIDFEDLWCSKHIDLDKVRRSIGTLGGGNHFIELDTSIYSNKTYLIVHSGSRRLGKEVAEYYMDRGHDWLKKMGEDVPYEMTYLTDYMGLNAKYIQDTEFVTEYATMNRRAIIDEICSNMKWKTGQEYNCIHNYIGVIPEEGYGFGIYVIRKGAISALDKELVIIPINMKDGVIIGRGKGNKDWNYSAPHGAGRLYSRKDAKNMFSVANFKEVMKGIFSTSINAHTIDESPFAYRGVSEIIYYTKDTIDVTDKLEPIYNFKSSER